MNRAIVFVVVGVLAVWALAGAPRCRHAMNWTRHDARVFLDEHGKRVDHLQMERAEQVEVARHVTPTDRVLELGGRYGSVSAVLLDILKDPARLVVVEPDPAVSDVLRRNLAAVHPRANVFCGAVSRRPVRLTFSGYGGETAACDNGGGRDGDGRDGDGRDGDGRDGDGRDGDGDKSGCTVPTLTYAQLQRRYNLVFDTIVADCEGCLPDLLDQIQEVHPRLEPVRKIMFEADGSKVDYDAVRARLSALGFRQVDAGSWLHTWVR